MVGAADASDDGGDRPSQYPRPSPVGHDSPNCQPAHPFGPPVRHRLDLGGNRRINSVVYIASVTQQRDLDARNYIDRKTAEGKTKTAREARRAHKRHLANRVIRRMWADERCRSAAPPIAA